MGELETENMSYRGDLGAQEIYNTSGENRNGETVFLKDYLHPEGENIQRYIREDTNSISKEVMERCKEIGYMPEENDKVACIMLAQVSKNGLYPSSKGNPGGPYNEAKAVLIENRKGPNRTDHKLLISRVFGTPGDSEIKDFLVEVGMYYSNLTNQYYTCKLHAKNANGKVSSLLFAPRKRNNYEEQLMHEKDLSRAVSGILRSAMFHSRRLEFQSEK
jgi:hypothetical protein